MPKLVIKKGNSIVKKLSVPRNIEAFTVGCERGNDIIIKDDSISFFHLQFEKQNGHYYVRDLQSQWGTLVNGEKISKRTLVNDNDEVKLGEHAITFTQKAAPIETAAEQEYRKRPEPVAQKEKIEDRIAGVPSLSSLNDWLNVEEDEVDLNPVLREPETNSAANEPVQNGFKLPDLDMQSEEFTPQSDFTLDNSDYMLQDDKPTILETSSDPKPIEEEKEKSGEYIIGTDESIFQSPTPPVITPPTKSDPANYVAKESFDHYETTAPAITKQLSDAAQYYLLGIYGYYIGRKYKIKQPETRIGRDGKLNDIVVRKNSKGKLDQSVSRRHATLSVKGGKWYLSDKRSKSRTWVNRKELTERDQERIRPGDEIEIVSDLKSHIFRMVKDGDWNYSFPRKAGAWPIRNIMNILNSSTALIALIAIFLMGSSFVTLQLIRSRPERVTLNEQIWGASDVDSKFEQSAAGSPIIQPAIADLNQDGFLDLVYVNNARRLICIDGKSKAPLWTNLDFEVDPSLPIALADLYNKGVEDVITVSKDSRLRVLDGKWGIEIWKSGILAGPLIGPPTIADFDGDGLKDLALASALNVVHLGFSTPNNFEWNTIDVNAPVRSTLSAGDVTGDNVADILVGTERGTVVIIDGFTQRILGQIDVNEELNKASGRSDQNNHIRFPTSLADLNADGINDIIIFTEEGNLVVLAGGTLKRLWYDMLPSPVANPGEVKSGIAIGDMDGDNQTDIVTQSPDGKLRAMKGLGPSKDRKLVLWEFPNQGAEPFVSLPVLTDFNKNGTLDVLTVSEQRGIQIIEGATGQVLASHRLNDLAVQSQPVVGDLDRDNHLDVLLLKDDGRFHKLASNSLTLDSTILWKQTYANSHHTSVGLPLSKNIQKQVISIIISIIMIVAIGSAQVLIRKSRSKLSYY